MCKVCQALLEILLQAGHNPTDSGLFIVHNTLFILPQCSFTHTHTDMHTWADCKAISKALSLSIISSKIDLNQCWRYLYTYEQFFWRYSQSKSFHCMNVWKISVCQLFFVQRKTLPYNYSAKIRSLLKLRFLKLVMFDHAWYFWMIIQSYIPTLSGTDMPTNWNIEILDWP